jgi:hypothetical protein
VLIGRILRSMLEGFIISVLYVVARSRKWYAFIMSLANLKGQDLSLLIVFAVDCVVGVLY